MEAQELDVLAVRAQAGDREAFRALVMATQTTVRVAIAWRVSSRDLVEEVLQETYVIAFQRLPHYRPEGTFVPWLKGIARIQIAKELHARRRHVALAGDAVDRALMPADPDDSGDADDGAVAAALRDCLAQLAPRARLLVERRYAEDLPLAILARQFKQKATTLATTLMRIRSSLHDCLKTKGLTS